MLQESDVNEPKDDELKQNNSDSEKVIMDLNPKKFDKKDHIFMDFFSMYGQNFIESKRA